MKNNLKLEHLSKRLPYGLKYKLPITSERMKSFIEFSGWKFVHSLETAIEVGYEDAIELNNLVLSQNNPFISVEEERIFLGQTESNLGFDVDDVFLDEVKPILFPLSCLTESITVKGETFNPLKRLTKLVYDPNNESIYDDEKLYKIVIGDLTEYCYPSNGEKTSHYWINYNEKMASFDHQEIEGCLPQKMMLEKLNEWHIDTDNLTEQGLAISVFELNENPYS